VLASEEHALEHWTPVHLHLGTVDVPARVAIPSEADIPPGESGFVQLVTDRPIGCLHGDRFVIRDQGARRTLGGGVVLDPFAPKRKRGAGLRTAELQVYERHSSGRVLAGLLELSEAGIDLQMFEQAMNLAPAAAEAAQRDAETVVLGKTKPIGITRTAADALTVRVLAAVRAFHMQQPQAAGIDVASLRAAVAPRLNPAAFQAFMRDLANRQLLVLSSDIARLQEHEASANPEDEQLWERVRQALLLAGVHTPLLADLAASLKIKEQPLRDFLHRKSRTGEIRKVTPERFCLKETLASLADTAVEVARGKDDGFFSAADFRDAIGTGRGLAIHYLEFFDQLGITQRFGDRRRVGKDFVQQLGPAGPVASPGKGGSAHRSLL
jgi:selenocysteine-specific elongation factor